MVLKRFPSAKPSLSLSVQRPDGNLGLEVIPYCQDPRFDGVLGCDSFHRGSTSSLTGAVGPP